MSLETMTKIGTYTVGAGGISSFSFSGIPQTYTDLIVKVSARVSGSEEYATAELRMQFNSDTTAANYKYMQHWGLGAGAVGSNTGSNFFFGNIEGGGMTANVFSTSEVCIPNYAGNSFKTTIWSSTEEASATNATIVNGLTKWSNTAPITSITILSNTNSFVQHSTFTLYGVKAMRTALQNNNPVVSGGTLTSDSIYYYRTFTSSGTFSVSRGYLTADVLSIAGGGGADSHQGGGGGAGGLVYAPSSMFPSNTNFAVTVGAGGTGGSDFANSGTNSTIGYIPAAVGGGAGGLNYYLGQPGGSGGGGASKNFISATNYGLGTSGQGNRGGNGTYPSGAGWYSGGGGGAGAVGGDAVESTNGGNGGVGTSAYSSWGLATSTGQNVSGTYYYAGGGGGGVNGGTPGTGGYGGGGAGSASTGTAGTANTGGGAGGGGNGSSGSNGGSGLVIIRYTKSQIL